MSYTQYSGLNKSPPAREWAALLTLQPLIPLNISKATYLQPPPDLILSTTNLIVQRAIALQKRQEDIGRVKETVQDARVWDARIRAALRFAEENQHTIREFNFKKEDLFLIQNTAIEKALNRKMQPHYLGPLIVILKNRGGAYVLCELDGTVFNRPIAAFWVVPYQQRISQENARFEISRRQWRRNTRRG